MPFLKGFLLGLSMILPIGPQNLFVLNQGLLGFRRGLLAAATTGVCDTLLILAGAAGLSATLSRLSGLRAVLLGVGAVFLAYLGIGSLVRSGDLRATAREAGAPSSGRQRGRVAPLPEILLAGVAVSWGNPHAILDTVAVLGSSIAAQGPATRLPFALGTVSASWAFFLGLAAAGATLGTKVNGSAQVWFARASGALMLLFAFLLGWEALR